MANNKKVQSKMASLKVEICLEKKNKNDDKDSFYCDKFYLRFICN